MASSPNGMSSTLLTMSLVNPPDQGSDRRGQDTEGLPPIGVSDAGEGQLEDGTVITVALHYSIHPVHI